MAPTQSQMMAYSLLVALLTLVAVANSAVYPYAQQESCSVKDLNMSQLAGDWHMLYHKNNLAKKIGTSYSQIDNNTVLASIREDGQLTQSFNLTQHPNLAGKLDNLINLGSYTIGVPTFVFAFEPDQFMTLYHAKSSEVESDEWAIYGRNTELSKENYDKAVQGLVCAGLVDAKDGKPLLHKL